MLQGTYARLFEGTFDALAAGTFLYAAIIEIIGKEFPAQKAMGFNMSIMFCLGLSLMAAIAIWA